MYLLYTYRMSEWRVWVSRLNPASGSGSPVLKLNLYSVDDHCKPGNDRPEDVHGRDRPLYHCLSIYSTELVQEMYSV